MTRCLAGLALLALAAGAETVRFKTEDGLHAQGAGEPSLSPPDSARREQAVEPVHREQHARLIPDPLELRNDVFRRHRQFGELGCLEGQQCLQAGSRPGIEDVDVRLAGQLDRGFGRPVRS